MSLGVLLASAYLAACGGGGGGGGGGPPPNQLVFTADKTSVSFDYAQNITPQEQVVTITATGTYNGTLYVAAILSSPDIAEPIPIFISGTTATVHFTPAANLSVGMHTGTVTLEACSDAACTQQVGNSPITVNYSIQVRAVLMVSPSPVSVTAVSGDTAAQTVAVQLPDGQTAFSAAVESGSPWLSITNVTATSFDVALSSLPSNTYNGSVTVTSGTSQVTLTVNYTVSAPAGGDQPMAVNPPNLTLATVEDGSTSAALGVTPPSWNPNVMATVQYISGSGWLSLTPTASGEQVLANAGALTAGNYTANIRIHGAYPSTDILVPVALTVGIGLMQPADVPLTLGAETVASDLSGAVPINVVAPGLPTTWHASSNVSWLILTNSNGATGSSLTYAVDTTQVGALANAAISSAQITITPALATMTPVAFNVNLNKNLPQITSLGPYTQLTGQPARVVLRGSGFNSIASPAARFTLAGATTNTVVVVNDTEVVAQFSALAAGKHIVAVSNALGLTTATGSVTAVSPPAYVYSAIPTGGSLRSLAYDAERESIYAANTTLATIMSFHYTGSAWAKNSVPFAQAYDVGLSQDGTTLFATATLTSAAPTAPGVIETLDPSTLATTQSMAQSVVFQPLFGTLGFGIPTTNDARTWLSVAPVPGGFGNLAYITAAALTPTLVTLNTISTDFDDGPWFAMSRDGERLIITQSASSGPSAMLYMNAADSVVRTNPGGATFSYYFSLSESGDKALFDNATLRDGAFNVLGTATIPAGSSLPMSYYAKNGQLTPDGTRIYVLSYRSDASTQPTVTPRVFVFDATSPAPNLTALGYFDVADYPTCVPDNNTGSCPGQDGSPSIAGAISLDGDVLFFAGDQKLLVVPVPSTLNTIGSAARDPATKSRQTPTTAWPLNLH
jgi:IPT/TIG domain-containing protein